MRLAYTTATTTPRWGSTGIIASLLACLLVGVGVGVAAAQTASQPRLRVVVRDEAGSGIAGVDARIYYVDDITEAPSPTREGKTDPQGILDFDITRWQPGGYRVRLAQGSSGVAVESVDDQGREYPPLELRLTKSGDEWLMLAILEGGKVTPDFSYSLSRPPRIQRRPPPTEKPVSYSELLQEAGLPVMLPYEKYYRPGATVTPLGGSGAGAAASPVPTPSTPTTGQAGGQAAGGAADYLTILVAVGALAVYLFRGRLVVAFWGKAKGRLGSIASIAGSGARKEQNSDSNDGDNEEDS